MRWTCYPIQTALGIVLLASGFVAAGIVVLVLSIRPARTGE